MHMLGTTWHGLNNSQERHPGRREPSLRGPDGTTTYKLLTILKRGEDKMTWGEKVGNNKRAIIK